MSALKPIMEQIRLNKRALCTSDTFEGFGLYGTATQRGTITYYQDPMADKYVVQWEVKRRDMENYTYNTTTSTTTATANIYTNGTTSTGHMYYGEPTINPFGGLLGCPVLPTQPQSKEESKVNANGKEFLIFRKGCNIPVASFDTKEEAMEEAVELTTTHEVVHYVYAPVSKVAPITTDVKVTDL